MTTGSLASEDIVTVLHQQHTRIRSMFAEVRDCSPAERQHLFDDLRAYLAVHEAAEELILRPATRKHDAESIADERNAEEKAAARMLAEMEDRGASDPGFIRDLTLLEDAVQEHALREETIELPRLIADADADERAMLGRRFIQAEHLAPTHPHPAPTGSTAAVMLTGPFASMIDRAKDALRGQSAPDPDVR